MFGYHFPTLRPQKFTSLILISIYIQRQTIVSYHLLVHPLLHILSMNFSTSLKSSPSHFLKFSKTRDFSFRCCPFAFLTSPFSSLRVIMETNELKTLLNFSSLGLLNRSITSEKFKHHVNINGYKISVLIWVLYLNYKSDLGSCIYV